MKLVIGLGNPGKEYTHTRHNVGWLALDHLARTQKIDFYPKKEFEAELADLHLGEERVFLVKPLTFMNLSGRSVQAVKHYYKIALEDLLVVHDEMDFPFGRMGFVKNGGAAGHHGIESIHLAFGTTSIGRLRIGIGRPTPPLKMDEYVLQRFSAEEVSYLPKILDRSAQAIDTWITQGLTQAMNVWNGVEYGLDTGADRADCPRAL